LVRLLRGNFQRAIDSINIYFEKLEIGKPIALSILGDAIANVQI
jgi:hypothetical protein